jgi:Transposase DDE domain
MVMQYIEGLTDRQAARQRQGTPQFKAQYALRAGVESSLSQGIRRFDLRRSRYFGLARTPFQQLLTATAMHVVWVIAWLWSGPLGERRRQPGHFAQLAPIPCHARQCSVKGGLTQQSQS